MYKLIIILFIFTQVACRKFVEIDLPVSKVTDEAVFSNDGTAESAMTGIYYTLSSENSFAAPRLHLYTGFSSDELINYSTSTIGQPAEFYSNSISITNGNNLTLWSALYNTIYQSNAVINGLSRSTGVSSQKKILLTAEAKFIRAFCYFYLVNLYGEVPLALVTDYRINKQLFRSSIDSVYQQILLDLTAAKQDLPTDHSAGLGERIRVNSYAASAMLARVYLYLQRWSDAEAESSLLIDNSDISFETDIDKVFIKESAEAIWQLLPLNTNRETQEGSTFILLGQPYECSLSDQIVDDFEASDLRRDKWIGMISVAGTDYYFPYKYKVYSREGDIKEYSVVLRLSEQYLIRSEARAQQNRLSGSIDDLDIIRQRAALPLIQVTNPGISKESLLLMIEHERKVEFFCEYGHRWLDLKRTNRANDILGILKGSMWQSYDQLYPIPELEINNNPNLTQNDNY